MATAAKRAGEQIRVAREARGWTLRDLARETDLDFGFVGKVERGALASVPVYERFAEALRLPLGALFDSHGSASQPRSASTSRRVKGTTRGGLVRRRSLHQPSKSSE
jgi:transcriptional regulator with XRE-family HTH domain